jgi:hypothetical protein
MKRVIKFLLVVLILIPAFAQAQDVKSILSSVAKAATTSASSTDVLGSLLGKTKVSQEDLVGTWTYSKPAVAFESSNLLKKAGGSIISSAVENKAATQLAKYGIKAGSMTFTFASDKTFTCKVGNRTTTGTYTVNGTNIVFTYVDVKTLTANLKQSGNKLQISFTANKLLTFLQGLNTLNASSQTLSTISSLMKSYNGMQLGLLFNKKK